ncbi:MAG: aspartyl aminopeptidase [Planctomycetota bacterium]
MDGSESICTVAGMKSPDLAAAREMCAYIDASTSPYHACSETAKRLEAVGFQRLSELDAWDQSAGSWYVIRGGSLVAWTQPEGSAPTQGFRILGAHTDSPNLRIKPRPDTGSAGWRQLGVEVYGGVLLNSWLDRDLGLSGRVWLRSEKAPTPHMFKISRPVLRIPQLAIHLHRELNTEGLKLNKQRHMVPVWGMKDGSEANFKEMLAAEIGVNAPDILSWEAMVHDTTPSAVTGWGEEFISAPRLDNLCSCYCSMQALIESHEDGMQREFIPVLCMFDHEEVGSQSRAGADGPILRDLLERSVLSRGGSREDYLRALADSVCVSADMAHATHPNYTEKHDPDHTLYFNRGPVIKLNANQRYASEGESEAIFQMACEKAQVPYQKWVMRTDLACGSTIGPITSSQLGIPTVDVGNPQLAMHSAREMCGSHDPGYMVQAMKAIL